MSSFVPIYYQTASFFLHGGHYNNKESMIFRQFSNVSSSLYVNFQTGTCSLSAFGTLAAIARTVTKFRHDWIRMSHL